MMDFPPKWITFYEIYIAFLSSDGCEYFPVFVDDNISSV